MEKVQRWKGRYHERTVGDTECIPLCDWSRDPSQMGRLTQNLTDRKYVNVYAQDGRILSSFWNCTLREVLALVYNEQRTNSEDVVVRDSEGYAQTIRGQRNV